MTPSFAHALAAVVVAVLALAGCRKDAPPAPDVVARVGDATLTEDDLRLALRDVAAGPDSVAARRHVVEQWVQRELLVQEARRQGLHERDDVRRQLAEAERSALEAAALEHLFAANPSTPDTATVRRYYEAHREGLALREPYVRLRHLRARSPQDAEQARAALARATASPFADSLFAAIAREHADDPAGAVSLAARYVPESQLLTLDEALGLRVVAQPAGPAVSVVPTTGAVHVVQVVDRVAAGTVPSLALVRHELTEALAIGLRRDTEARALQQLRAEAEARGRLVVR